MSLVGGWRAGTIIPGTPDTSRVSWRHLLLAESFTRITSGERGDLLQYCRELLPGVVRLRAKFTGPLDQGADLADLSTRIGHAAK